MAEADWDEVSYARKKPMRAAEARSQKASASAYACMRYATVVTLINAHLHDARPS